MKRRIKLLLMILLESVIPLIVLIYKSGVFNLYDNSKAGISVLIIIGVWCFLSYFRGRYQLYLRSNIKNKIIYQFREISLISTLIIIVSLFYRNLEILEISDLLIIKEFLFILIPFSIINQLFILLIFEIIRSNHIKIYFLGEESEMNNLINDLPSNNYFKNISFKLVTYKNEITTIPDELIVADSFYIDDKANQLIRNCYINGIQILTLSKWYEKNLQRIPSDFISFQHFLNTKSFPTARGIQRRIKRVGDVTLSLFLLIISSPIILLSGILIWLNDRGPIFYSQIRSGIWSQKIKIFKLRTMRIDAEKNGVQWSQKNDSRITSIGRFLRKSRIDELPQLISVLKGDMSLIGPRPERPELEVDLNKEISNYALKMWIRPGLSGWAQVNYPYGASIEDTKNKLSYDIYYIWNFSIWLDLLILIKTIKLVLSGSGSIPGEKFN